MARELKVTHVLYLSDVAGRGAFSGAENHVLALLAALAAAKVDVELIALLWAGSEFTRVENALERLRAAGVKVVVVRGNLSAAAKRWAMIRAWNELRRLLALRQDRVLHLHLDHFFAPVLARMSGSRRVVFSIHNDEPFYRRPALRAWFKVLNRLVVRYIAITEHVRRYFIAASGARPDAVTTIYYGVPVPSGEPSIQKQQGKFTVGFVGRLADQKNLEIFVDALAGLPDVAGIIVGDGPNRQRLEARASAAGAVNLHFAGHQPNGAAQMRAFDVFCLPSLHEGLGLVLVEAMLQDVPVMGSRRGAIPEVLGDGAFGLLFEPDAASLRAAIQNVRDNHSAARERAAMARRHAEQVFATETMVLKTCQVYHDVEANADAAR